MGITNSKRPEISIEGVYTVAVYVSLDTVQPKIWSILSSHPAIMDPRYYRNQMTLMGMPALPRVDCTCQARHHITSIPGVA